ncbi:MAG: hypothetical protein SFV81_16745 [Pirellulaceae bacterium]|nr:hypothetical protein [Pirellulaceae bacterium]
MSTEQKVAKKGRGTSVPLIIGLLILGVGGYYAGPTLMTYVFYVQEMIIAGSGTKGGDLPTTIVPDTSGDPNVGPGPSVDGPGLGAPGSSTATAPEANPAEDKTEAKPEAASASEAPKGDSAP